MCRGNDHSGRRCPSDTSEARQLRRNNSTARESYSSLVVKPVESKALPPVEPVEQVTAESVRTDIAGLDELRIGFRGTCLNKDIIQTAYDKQLNTIGAGVWQLAEEKYGAPTDEELKNIHEEKEKSLTDAADVRKEELKAELQTLYDRGTELRSKLYEIASPATHPNVTERNQLWKEQVPDILEQFGAAQKEILDAEIGVTGTHRHIASETAQAVREGLEKRNAAVKEALTEIGVEFANPDTLKFSEDSHTDAVKSLKKALEFFPQQWVDNSNAYHHQTELRVKRSKGRAHYSSSREQTKRTNGTKASIEVQPEGWKPDTDTLDGKEYFDMKGEKVWVDPVSGQRQRAVYVPEGNQTWARLRYDYGDSPKKGWEEIEYAKTTYSREERSWVKTGERATIYRKQKLEHVSTTWEKKAELTVSKDQIVRVGDDAGFRVAMHEFSHRVEHTTPVIAGYEEAFLKRRAGHLPQTNPSGEREELSPIYGGKEEEVGYADNFPTHYMGKVYDGSFREILSMGMETLFAGNNGAFVGMQGYKADPDYKKFVLGVLASTVNK